MDVMEIQDYWVLERQPAQIIDWKMEILEKRGAFQTAQAKRAETTANRPPADIERSD